MWLLQCAETFVTLVEGCGGTLGRHQRLAQVVRVARMVGPDVLSITIEERCKKIHDQWREAAKKLGMIMYSLQMREEAFMEIACSQNLGADQSASSTVMMAATVPARST